MPPTRNRKKAKSQVELPNDGLYQATIAPDDNGSFLSVVAVRAGAIFELKHGRSHRLFTSAVSRFEVLSDLSAHGQTWCAPALPPDGDYVAGVRNEGGHPIPTIVQIREGRIHDQSGVAIRLSEISGFTPDEKDLQIAQLRTALEEALQAADLMVLGLEGKGFMSVADVDGWRSAKSRALEVLA